MKRQYYDNIPSPCFVQEENKLINNLEILKYVRENAPVQILVALKGYAFWHSFPLIKKYLDGASASSLFEAKLINEEMGVKAHTYCPAYLKDDFEEIANLSKHLTFNSLSQWDLFKNSIKASISCGLRINPEYSEIDIPIYNPAINGSRLGMVKSMIPDKLPDGIEGLLFHVMCEQDSYVLERVLQKVKEKFHKQLMQVNWLNMGGGHWITDKNYDVNHLINLLNQFHQDYPHLQLIMEPGEAIGLGTGFLLATVQDIVENNGIKTAILDVSFSAHMPDTLEMPYKPIVRDANIDATNSPYKYRLGGISCLAGDYMSEYGFESPLQLGDQIIFEDMIHYTMVKTTLFNGVKHPYIGVINQSGDFELLRAIPYEYYKYRLS
ncbi:MAG: Carboxynorspermidine/carboxyspermidine decarboxylase [Bacteroidetes bacterium ADurb.Bin035]|jgi:carboxynorspermidine decarboxylase|nr:MAG: Carboxynorspermidine/carboxyspermidine decarboxylase [Bacteroidetes bacterium ADurb.Bin035]HPM39399.1 carboxynorspermidine decarboxylase [Bacteroidales bacterium]HPX45096.1 carboxynorspermidine decarboxylase [Bacteroidales bacterium]HRT72684.1 carboxynorspermidine decarboxylase [Bacteroidales bacterium]